jgi:CobQ-like glutamine amidotransferase family enzyme
LAGVPMLTICGTYQLFGHGFTTLEGQEIPGISIFNARTMGSTKRMIGNIIVESDFGRLVGFENHSGQTLLEASQKTLGKVVQGFGNDGESEYEGAMVNNTFGTYLHGPMLPKNPTFTDHLILTALRNRYGVEELKPLQDDLENSAAKVAASRPQ